MKIPKPVVLIVLDGWGIAPPGPTNAITQANLPTYKVLWENHPHTQLLASGEPVGLPHGEAGNSEVGHINMGAGYIVYQDLMRINRAIADGSFFTNPSLLQVVQHVHNNNSNLHIMGLVSPGGVHSSLDHLYALLRFLESHMMKGVFLHAFTDGRDSPPTSAQIFLSEIDQEMKKLGVGKIASIVGRYYAMDRDLRWGRTQIAYEFLTRGKGRLTRSVLQAVSNAYKRGETDEFINPTIVAESQKSFIPIQDGDAVIFFNFRTDRPRQLTSAFVQPNFSGFRRGRRLSNLFFVTMTRYEPAIGVSGVIFEPFRVDLPLVRILSERNLRQLHISESEKFPHVTYFFNGGHEDPFPGEDRVEIPSPTVATYDQKPEMSAFPLSEVLLERLGERMYDFILVNYANADMVAHTGDMLAAVTAVETIDECLTRVIPQVRAVGGVALITADHGNVEVMVNPRTLATDTEHNVNPVPFIFVGATPSPRELSPGILADIAPTVLALLKIPEPSSMTARDLLG